MAMTPPTVTLTTPFVPAPTCYQPGHFSQINDLNACWTGQRQPGAVTCQRATYGPGHPQWDADRNTVGCITDPKQTALTECPSGFTAAATNYRITVRGTERATATNTYCCPSEYDFFFEQQPNDKARIPRLQSDKSVKWDTLRLEEHRLCFATSVKPLQSQSSITVTLGRMKPLESFTEEELAEADGNGVSGREYQDQVLAAAEEVKAVWDYANGVLVAYPQKVVKYVREEKTYWGDYEYWKDLVPAGTVGTAGEGWVEAPATATAEATEGLVASGSSVQPTGTGSSSGAAAAASSSSSTSAGYKNQGMKLSGILCASIMGLGLLLSI